IVSYGLTVELLAGVLPTGGDINVAGLHRNLQGLADGMEAELGEEKWHFIDGCQREWDMLLPPRPPLIVGLDGGFIHSKDQKSRGEGWFEVIAGKSMPEEGAAKCFAYVQSYDTKPKRRLFELMKSQGLQANQQVIFLSDGADDVREFRGYIEANQNFIPNYGDRYRHGEKISTAFAESAVNQVVSKRMVKKQQMRWTESGAHNLLQVRTKVLNDQLRETFVRWYPGMQTEQETQIEKKAA